MTTRDRAMMLSAAKGPGSGISFGKRGTGSGAAAARENNTKGVNGNG
jgi:hypothetical protein